MPKSIHSADHAGHDRRSMVACNQLLAYCKEDPYQVGEQPSVTECRRLHEALESHRNNLLARQFSWSVIFEELCELAGDWPMPVMDAMRRDNGLGKFTEFVISQARP